MYTLEQIAEEVFILKGQYNGISADVKEIKHEVKELRSDMLREIKELYNKTERDKTELIERIERGKAELLKELLKWMLAMFIGFATLIITALWAILNFAIK